MKRIAGLAVGLAVLMAAPVWAGSKPKKKAASAPALTEGAYSASVKAIVCRGCGSFIEETLKKVEGIESAAVDSDKAIVSFKVKKGAKVIESELQKKLSESAAKMGMGADYTLSAIKKSS